MSSTASKIPRKVCAPLSKSASPTGKTAEPHFIVRCKVQPTPALTLPHARLTLSFQFAAGVAGKAVRIGRGPATVIGSNSRKPGHPPLAQRPAPFARKGDAGSPRASRGAFFLPVEFLAGIVGDF